MAEVVVCNPSLGLDLGCEMERFCVIETYLSVRRMVESQYETPRKMLQEYIYIHNYVTSLVCSIF